MLLYSRNWQRFTQLWSPLFCSIHDFTHKKQVILEIRHWGICEVSNKKNNLKYDQCCFRFTNRHHNFLVQKLLLNSTPFCVPQNSSKLCVFIFTSKFEWSILKYIQIICWALVFCSILKTLLCCLLAFLLIFFLFGVCFQV